MKRLLVVLLLLVLVVPTAFADGVEVSALSDEDLLALRDAIETEINSRGLDGSDGVKAWYDYGLGQYVPDPVSVFGHDVETEDVLKSNSMTMFMDTVKGITREEFVMYSEATYAMGFTNIIETSGNWWEATREDGIHVRLVYLTDELHIDVDPPKN